MLAEILEKAAVEDQLNLPKFTSMEIVTRRLTIIGEAHAANPTNPDYTGSDVFLGLGKRRGGALVNPALSAYSATLMRDEAAVAKERRKAREERTLRPEGGGGGYGGGGGGRGGRRGRGGRGDQGGADGGAGAGRGGGGKGGAQGAPSP